MQHCCHSSPHHWPMSQPTQYANICQSSPQGRPGQVWYLGSSHRFWPRSFQSGLHVVLYSPSSPSRTQLYLSNIKRSENLLLTIELHTRLPIVAVAQSNEQSKPQVVAEE